MMYMSLVCLTLNMKVKIFFLPILSDKNDTAIILVYRHWYKLNNSKNIMLRELCKTFQVITHLNRKFIVFYIWRKTFFFKIIMEHFNALWFPL